MGQARRQRQAEDKRVCIAYIHPGQVSSFFCESLLATVLYDAWGHRDRPRRIQNIYQDWSSANISEARNRVTRRFLDRQDADWLLYIDSDMRWSPLDVDALLEVADHQDRPIVGGLAFGLMGEELYPTIYHFAEIDGQPTTIRIRNYPRDELIKVAATGAAFLLVHRSVLQAIADRQFNAAFPWFQETQHGDKPVGEDITFCLRAISAGFPIFVHTGIRIGHHKSQVLTEEMFIKEMAGQAAGGTEEST